MVSLVLKHHVQWQAPMPVWAENSSLGMRVSNEALAPYPSILRFATDTFMQDMIEVMQDNPSRIGEWLAQPETWREPMKTPAKVTKPTTESSVEFLLNKTRKLTDEHRTPGSNVATKRQNLVPAGATVDTAVDTNMPPIKLFHSTHQRFYLVSASLILNEAGFPDQTLNLSSQEKASFVLRRLVPPEGMTVAEGDIIDHFEDWHEYAFVDGDNGTNWVAIDQSSSLACRKLLDREEQLPLFPISYADDCGHSRALLSGLIPVGKREKWMAAPVSSASATDSLSDDFGTVMSRARVLFQTDVAEPWKILVEQALFKSKSFDRVFSEFPAGSAAEAETDNAIRTERDIIQMASWYVLLDFARFLEKFLPELWAVLNDETPTRDLTDNETQLFNTIRETRLSNALIEELVELDDQYLVSPLENPAQRRLQALNNGTVVRRLSTALRRIKDLGDNLEAVENAFVRFGKINNSELLEVQDVDEKWPGFLFPLADPNYAGAIPPEIDSPSIEYINKEGLAYWQEKIDAIALLVEQILPEPHAGDDWFAPRPALSQRDGWFVIRCVYERPHCGPLFPAVVSAPTRLFQMAPFFDPDAPARPIRIPMPVDISPAGLRKFQKNTGFVISDMLCGKIKKIRKMSLGDLVLSVLPWPFHKDLPDPGDTGPCKNEGLGFGMICSLSIPIVTLCALIILMIMVALFDLFFRWLPFLFVCLPIPGLKGKKK
jgi:hypothetical protein